MSNSTHKCQNISFLKREKINHYIIQSNLNKCYNMTQKRFIIMKINNILFRPNSRTCSMYNDMILFNDKEEKLKAFYEIEISYYYLQNRGKNTQIDIPFLTDFYFTFENQKILRKKLEYKLIRCEGYTHLKEKYEDFFNNSVMKEIEEGGKIIDDPKLKVTEKLKTHQRKDSSDGIFKLINRIWYFEKKYLKRTEKKKLKESLDKSFSSQKGRRRTPQEFERLKIDPNNKKFTTFIIKSNKKILLSPVKTKKNIGLVEKKEEKKIPRTKFKATFDFLKKRIENHQKTKIKITLMKSFISTTIEKKNNVNKELPFANSEKFYVIKKKKLNKINTEKKFVQFKYLTPHNSQTSIGKGTSFFGNINHTLSYCGNSNSIQSTEPIIKGQPKNLYRGNQMKLFRKPPKTSVVTQKIISKINYFPKKISLKFVEFLQRRNVETRNSVNTYSLN